MNGKLASGGGGGVPPQTMIPWSGLYFLSHKLKQYLRYFEFGRYRSNSIHRTRSFEQKNSISNHKTLYFDS